MELWLKKMLGSGETVAGPVPWPVHLWWCRAQVIVGDAVGHGIDPANGVIAIPHRQIAVWQGHPTFVKGIEVGITLGSNLGIFQ